MMIPGRMLILGVTLVAAGVFVLFQKRMLPSSIAPVVSKIYFWPTLPFTVLRAWDNYWTLMDDTLYLGAAPLSFLGHADQLQKLGVTGIINMCSEYRGPVEAYKHYNIEQLWLPTTDHEEPELRDMESAVFFIKKHEKAGNKVLVHCKAGHGRSSAIAMAWLLTNNPDIVPSQVQQEMLAKRRVRKFLYKQPNLRIYYRNLLTSTDGGSRIKDRKTSSGYFSTSKSD